MCVSKRMVTTVCKQEGVNEHFTDILTLCQILYGTDRSCTLSKKLMTGLSANHNPPPSLDASILLY